MTRANVTSCYCRHETKTNYMNNGFNNCPKFGIVLVKKVSCTVNPTTKADYGLWGSHSATFDHDPRCSALSSTSNLVYKPRFQVLLRDILFLLL